jgi:hypothetical protein
MENCIKDDSYDTINLVHDANFEIVISPNLFWVPVNVLGITEYKNCDIRQFINYTPEEKRKVIKNVYEAIQLFQICRFEEKIDVLRFEYNGKEWEHHKPGYYAVLSNTGCCSSIASWLHYLVGGRYPQDGYFGYSRPDSSGHIFNYFFINGYYYIIDINTMLYNNAYKCCKETGNKRDFINTKYITGCCYKTTDLHAFIKFYSRILRYKNFEFLYYTQPPDNYIPPISSRFLDDGSVEITVTDEIEVLNETQGIKIIREPGPNYSPNWNFYLNKSLSKTNRILE